MIRGGMIGRAARIGLVCIWLGAGADDKLYKGMSANGTGKDGLTGSTSTRHLGKMRRRIPQKERGTANGGAARQHHR
eukprot:9578061-Heterocapsa_arctica.AAC.1